MAGESLPLKTPHCLAPASPLAVQAPVSPWEARTLFEFVFKPERKRPGKRERNLNAVLTYLTAAHPATSEEHRALSAPFEFFLEREASGYFFAAAYLQLLEKAPTPQDFERLFQLMLAHESFVRESPWWNNTFRKASAKRALILYLLNPPAATAEQRVDGSFVRRNADRLRRIQREQTAEADETVSVTQGETAWIEEFLAQARRWDRQVFQNLSDKLSAVPDDRHCVLLRIGTARDPEQQALIVFRNEKADGIVYRLATLPGNSASLDQAVIEAENRRTGAKARISVELQRLLHDSTPVYSLRFAFVDSSRHWVAEDLDIQPGGYVEFRDRPHFLTDESLTVADKHITVSLGGIVRELFSSSRTFRYFSGPFDDTAPCDASL